MKPVLACLFFVALSTSVPAQSWEAAIDSGDIEKAYELVLPEYENYVTQARNGAQMQTMLKLIKLGATLRDNADYGRAERLHLAELEGLKNSAFGDEQLVQMNLYQIYTLSGQFDKAVLALEKTQGAQNFGQGANAAMMTTLARKEMEAQFFDMIGRPTEALRIYLEVEKIRESLPELKTVFAYGTAKVQAALDIGLLQAKLGQPDKARERLAEALEIMENPEKYAADVDQAHAKKMYGLRFPNDAGKISDINLQLGDQAEARKWLEQALDRNAQTSFGDDFRSKQSHQFERANLLGKLGRLECMEGNFESGIARLQSLLSLYEPLGVSPSHPGVIQVNEEITLATHFSGEDTTDLLENITANRAKLTQAIFEFGSLKQRLEYMAHADAWSIPASLENPEKTLETILRFKGAALDSIIEDRQIARSDGAAYDELVRKRRLLMEATLGGKPTESLQAEVAKLEDAMARKSAERAAFQLTVEQLRAAIPDDTTLCEFVRYTRHNEAFRPSRDYGAILLSKDSGPSWIPLGQAAPIDEQIHACRELIQNQAADSELEASLKKLYQEIIAPIEDGVKTASLVIAPDAGLNFLPFAILLDAESTFAAEKWLLQFVSTGRDLLRDSTETDTSTSLLVFNPTFDQAIAGGGEGATAFNRSVYEHERSLSQNRALLEGVEFVALPGTQREGEILKPLLSGEVSELSGPNATEESLTNRIQQASPSILHIATHGFYLPEGESEFDFEKSRISPLSMAASQSQPGSSALPPSPTGLPANPLYQTGLALTGAQNTVESWSNGVFPRSESDGILLADEIGSLNLANTKLVVLSACETALGDVVSGEGVFGLKRAFALAGAENLLMTLWPIADQQTVEIIEDFYARLPDATSPSEALAETQRKYLKQHRQENLWNAVYFAGPFVLTVNRGL